MHVQPNTNSTRTAISCREGRLQATREMWAGMASVLRTSWEIRSVRVLRGSEPAWRALARRLRRRRSMARGLLTKLIFEHIPSLCGCDPMHSYSSSSFSSVCLPPLQSAHSTSLRAHKRPSPQQTPGFAEIDTSEERKKKRSDAPFTKGVSVCLFALLVWFGLVPKNSTFLKFPVIRYDETAYF